jgi:hypothetical protein
VEVKAKTSFILGTVYRANYTDLLTDDENESELEEQLSKATSKSSRLIVTGDLNCDTTSEKHDKSTKSLIELFETYSMSQLISKPTRIELETNNHTTIDHIWANTEDNLIKDSGTIEGISDHVGIYMKTNIMQLKPAGEKIRFRSYKNYSPENFNTDLEAALSNSELTKLIDTEKVEEATELWIKIFSDIANRHAPLIEKVKPKKMKKIPWYNEKLDALFIEKNRKLQLYRLYRLPSDLKVMKAISNKITHLKRKLKRSYYTDKINGYDEIQGRFGR